MGKRKKLKHDPVTGHALCPNCGCSAFGFKMDGEKREIMYCHRKHCTWWMAL